MARWAAIALALGACGRISFDASSDGGVDAPPGDSSSAAHCATIESSCSLQEDQSCCASSTVPGGTFFRSYDIGTDNAFPDMTAPATVSAFTLDTYEVTIGRFRAFVNAGGGTQENPPALGAGANPHVAGTGWISDYTAGLPADTATLVKNLDDCGGPDVFSSGTRENKPMSCISWYEAFAFCAWDGGRLPTEAEWNFAAAGGSDQRKWPWSTSPTEQIEPGEASFAIGTDCVGDGLPGCDSTDFVTPGHFPAGNGRWGHADLTGNVWEWTFDAYLPFTTPCDDCAPTAAVTTDRVFHGGGAGNHEDIARPAYRNTATPAYTFYDVGVRCAR